MADIPYIQQAQEVKITGQDNTGATVNYVGADSSGNLFSNVQIQATHSDKSGTGTISALNGTVVATTNGCSTVQFNSSGTWVMNLIIEALVNATWVSIAGDIDSIDTITNAFSGNTLVTVPCGGFPQVRVRCNLYTSGTATIDWNSGSGSSTIEVFNANGNALKVVSTQPSSDFTGSGTIAALNATVIATTQGCSCVTFDVTGTWVATIVIEATVGDGNWFGVNGDIDINDTIAGSFTTNTFVTIPCGSFSQVRLRTSLYTSGTANITWDSSVGSNIVEIFNTTPASLQATVRLNDGSGNSVLSINNQLETRDVLNVSSQYRAQSITTTAGEALGAGTILANRKLLHITPTNGTIYWGYSNTVTTATGTPIFPNNTLWLTVTDNIHVFLIAATTIDSRIGEAS